MPNKKLNASRRALEDSEAKYRALFEGAQAGVMVVDLETLRFVDANPQALAMFGLDYDKLGRLGPQDVSTDPDATLANFKRFTAETQNAPVVISRRLRRRDGSEFEAEIFQSPVTIQGRAKIMAIITDVSRRKALEAEVQQRQAELAHVLRVHTLGEMTTMLAHEINQPLSAISTYAQGSLRLAHNRNLTRAETERVLEMINDNALRASGIITRIRTLLRGQKGVIQVCNLNRLILDSMAILAAEGRAWGVVLTTDLALGLPDVRGDSVQLQQVLMNLVLNAMEAMAAIPRKNRRVVIATRTLAGAGSGDGVQVTVADQGAGLSGKALTHLFESFFTTKPGGLGMGLSICTTIVEAHGGKLWLDATGPSGSTFAFTIPFRREAGS
ncbi:MAG: PAS domain S-box protein [Alphaproteobacteria bacterium]|nr:PAS domain S-box protein [Alphaproteobacteria bacterium]